MVWLSYWMGERPFSGFAEAQIAPLVDLQKPTFYVTGQTELLDGAWLDRWLEEYRCGGGIISS